MHCDNICLFSGIQAVQIHKMGRSSLSQGLRQVQALLVVLLSFAQIEALLPLGLHSCLDGFGSAVDGFGYLSAQFLYSMLVFIISQHLSVLFGVDVLGLGTGTSWQSSNLHSQTWQYLLSLGRGIIYATFIGTICYSEIGSYCTTLALCFYQQYYSSWSSEGSLKAGVKDILSQLKVGRSGFVAASSLMLGWMKPLSFCNGSKRTLTVMLQQVPRVPLIVRVFLSCSFFFTPFPIQNNKSHCLNLCIF